MALCGMDPMRFLTSEDDLEVLVMQAVSQSVGDLRREAAEEAKHR